MVPLYGPHACICYVFVLVEHYVFFCSLSPDHRGKVEAAPAAQHQPHGLDKSSSQPNQHPDINLPSSSTDSADVVQLNEDAIRRRILEVKKQKKGTSAWHAASSPYAVAAFFAIIAVVIISLCLIPEDSRFFNSDGRRQKQASSSNEDDEYGQDQQQDMYEQEQEQRRWQRQEREERNDPEEGADWDTGQDNDDFYQNSGSGSQGADDDDYAPWNDKSSRHVEPAHSRTHRVVQQRIVPPDAGEKLSA